MKMQSSLIYTDKVNNYSVDIPFEESGVKETTVCEPKALSISSTMGKVYLEAEIMIK